MKYVLDANSISFWIRGDAIIADKIRNEISQGSSIVIPPTAYYEVLRGFKHKSAPKKEQVFSLICNSYDIGKMDISSWDEAAEIYAQSRKIGKAVEDSDILIAAYCIINGCTLVTNNTKHFVNISGLNTVDWSK